MQNSKIEWCDHTLNPWIGCQKVSAGCQHCYAETLMDHRYHKVQWGPTGQRQRTSPALWRKPLQWDKEARNAGIRYRVFCASLADIFEDRPELEPWRIDLFKLIEQTHSLDWLLLTKRPQNVAPFIEQAQVAVGATPNARGWLARFRNVWIGASVEDQAAATQRIPHLLQIPAAVRFLSCEPLLGPLDLWGANYPNPNGGQTGAVTSWPGGVQWVIAGGESGHSARPMHPHWARSLRDQCRAVSVPYFFKQWGNWAPCTHFAITEHTDMTKIHRFADGQLMQRISKGAAGRKLDDREWNQFPSQPDQPTATETGQLYSAGCAL